MARARTIKHGFFTNDSLASLPMATRLLFAGLWTIADRAGRLLDRPMKIKGELFPYDQVDVNEGLQQLADAGFLVRYEADEQRLIQVVHWDKHQHPHINEAQSELEAPPIREKHRVSTEPAPQDSGRSPVSGTLNGSCNPVSGHRVTPSLRAHARAREAELDQNLDLKTCGACGTTLNSADRRRKLPLCGECHGAALFAAARAQRNADLLNAQDLIDLASQARHAGDDNGSA